MRINYKDVNIELLENLENFLGEELRLVNIRPTYSYVNKKRTDNIDGYKYEVVLINKGFEKVEVKIEKPINFLDYLTQDDLDKGVKVEFIDLKEKIYARASDGFINYYLTLIASDIKVLDDN